MTARNFSAGILIAALSCAAGCSNSIDLTQRTIKIEDRADIEGPADTGPEAMDAGPEDEAEPDVADIPPDIPDPQPDAVLEPDAMAEPDVVVRDPCLPSEEVCDGVDNDCDGDIDEEDPELGDSCRIEGALGMCNQGTLACNSGALICEGQTASVEVCDGQDNDCDGAVDESDDLFPRPVAPSDSGMRQLHPTVTASEDRVLVVWQETAALGDAPTSGRLYYAITDINGTPITGRTLLTESGGQPVATLVDGDFIAAWVDDEAGRLRGAHISHDGPLGDRFDISGTESQIISLPALASTLTGGFIAAWRQERNGGVGCTNTDAESCILARTFSGDIGLRAIEISSEEGAITASRPVLSFSNEDGPFTGLIAWHEHGASSTLRWATFAPSLALSGQRFEIPLVRQQADPQTASMGGPEGAVLVYIDRHEEVEQVHLLLLGNDGRPFFPNPLPISRGPLPKSTPLAVALEEPSFGLTWVEHGDIDTVQSLTFENFVDEPPLLTLTTGELSATNPLSITTLPGLGAFVALSAFPAQGDSPFENVVLLPTSPLLEHACPTAID